MKMLGKMGLRDQNNGKRIGSNGSWIYHVTTLTLQYGRLFQSKRNENQSSEFLSERTRWSSMPPWKKSLKVQNFEVVNSAICAIFTLCHCKNLASECWSDFSPENFYFEIFSKTNVVSITFGLRYIHGQSLKEIDFPTRNAVDRF